MRTLRAVAILLFAAIFAPHLRAEFPLSAPQPGGGLGPRSLRATVETDAGTMVFWGEGAEPQQLRGALLPPSGAPSSSFNTPVQASELVTAASDGTSALLLVRCHDAPARICRLLVRPDGVIAGPSLETGLIADDAWRYLAWDGERYVFLFVNFASSSGTIRLGFLDREGRLLSESVVDAGVRGQAPIVSLANDGSLISLRYADALRLFRVGEDGAEGEFDGGRPDEAFFAATPVTIVRHGDRTLFITIGNEPAADRNRIRYRRMLGDSFVEEWTSRDPLRNTVGPIDVTVSDDGWRVLYPSESTVDGEAFRTFETFSLPHEGLPGPARRAEMAVVAPRLIAGGRVVAHFDHSYPVAIPTDSIVAIDPPFARHDLTVVSRSTAGQYDPAGAWTGGRFLVAWIELDGEARWTLRWRLFDDQGAPLGTERSLPSSSSQVRPRVASDGSSTFLLVWSEGIEQEEAIRAVRVSVDGNVLDPAPLELFPSYRRYVPRPWYWNPLPVRAATVAWNGFEWIVATEADRQVAAAAVPPAGPLRTLPESRLPEYPISPAMDCLEESCLVAWYQVFSPGCHFDPCPIAWAVVAQRFTRDYAPAGDPVELARYVGPLEMVLAVSANRARNEFLVSAGSAGRRVTRSGEALDGEVRGWSGRAAVIPEVGGWRVIGTPDYPGMALTVHAESGGEWGSFAGVRSLLPGSAKIAAPALIAAPRPLALFTRLESDGSTYRAYGRFLDEPQGEPLVVHLEANPGTRVLSWSTSFPADSYVIEALADGAWQPRAYLPREASKSLDVSSLLGSTFRVIARTGIAQIASNPVTFERRRAVGR